MGELINRVADNWRPLFAIADVLAGLGRRESGRLPPPPTRQAASSPPPSNYCKTSAGYSMGGSRPRRWRGPFYVGLSLTAYPRRTWSSQLVAIEGRPWAEWKGGRPITQNGLARLLDRFGIRPGTIRLHTGPTPKGYYRSAFDDASRAICPSNRHTVTTQ